MEHQESTCTDLLEDDDRGHSANSYSDVDSRPWHSGCNVEGRMEGVRLNVTGLVFVWVAVACMYPSARIAGRQYKNAIIVCYWYVCGRKQCPCPWFESDVLGRNRNKE